VRIPGRAQFANVIKPQLALYRQENAELLRRVVEAERAYRVAAGSEAEEAYGDYMDLVEEAEEELLALRDRYAETMAARERLRYEREFTRAAHRLLPSLSSRRAFERAMDPDSEI
jgi:hypothetical protein